MCVCVCIYVYIYIYTHTHTHTHTHKQLCTFSLAKEGSELTPSRRLDCFIYEGNRSGCFRKDSNFLRLTGIEPWFINHPACTWVAAQTELSRVHAYFIQNFNMSQYSESLNTTQQLNNTKTPPVSTPRCAVITKQHAGERLHIRAIWLYWSNKTNHVLTTYDKLWGAT